MRWNFLPLNSSLSFSEFYHVVARLCLKCQYHSEPVPPIPRQTMFRNRLAVVKNRGLKADLERSGYDEEEEATNDRSLSGHATESPWYVGYQSRCACHHPLPFFLVLLWFSSATKAQHILQCIICRSHPNTRGGGFP